MQTIWKFKLKMEDVQVLSMPSGAKILTVQVQDDSPHIWALVDSDQPKGDRHIEIYSTGHAMTDGMGNSREYIGTFQLLKGQLVFHVFEYTGV